MAVRTEKKTNTLFIDFYCYAPDGRKIRCRESTGLKDNKKNLKIAVAKNKAIQFELKHGKFDYLHFFPHGSKAHLFHSAPSDILFREWWDMWLSEKSLRYNTAKGWASSYRLHIGPHFGHYGLSQIDEHEVLVFRKFLEGKGLKASSINDKIMKPLCMALLHAYKRGKIFTYPCSNIKRLPEALPDIEPLTPDELRYFLSVLKKNKPDFHDLILIWSRTGLRVGEICALEWKHVNYFDSKMAIRQTMLSNGTIGPPKTTPSIRDVDMRPVVVEALKRQEARTGLLNSFVFLTHAQKPFTDAFLRKKFSYLLKLAKLKYRSPKQMRHTFASLSIGGGENISWVSKMLGHSNPQITLKRYNRYVKNLTHDDGSALDRLLDTEVEKGRSKAEEYTTT